MLYPLAFLGSLGVIETVKRSHEVAGYPADPFKRYGIIVILNIHLFAVYRKSQFVDDTVGMFLPYSADILVDLSL